MTYFLQRPKLTLTLALLILLIIFVLQNTQDLSVHFLIFSFTMRRFVLIFLVLLIGFFAGWTFRGQFIDKKDITPAEDDFTDV